MEKEQKNYVSSLMGTHLSRESYLAGFILSLALTVLPYLMVVDRGLPAQTLVAGVILFALFQLLVQSVSFLHLKWNSEARWNFVTFLFTLMVVAILVVGSLWIMAHLDHNTMYMIPEP